METWLLILLGILSIGIITAAIVVPVVLVHKHKEREKVKKKVKRVHKKPLTKEEEKMFNNIMNLLDTKYKKKWRKSLPKSELKKIALCAIEQVESRAGGLDIANNYLAKFGVNKTAEAEMCDILYKCGFMNSPTKCVPLEKPGVKRPPPPPPIIEIKHPLIDCTETQNSCWWNVSPRNQPCIIPNANCNFKTGKCVECNIDKDCITATKNVNEWANCLSTRCNNNRCVQCNKDSDCPIGGQLCRGNKCTQCNKDGDCTSPAKCLQYSIGNNIIPGLPFDTTQINVCRVPPFCIDSRQCSNKGICVSQQTACECIPGWEGERCEHKSGKPIQCRTRNDCSNHGNCIDAKCKCESGWTGTYCQTKT